MQEDISNDSPDDNVNLVCTVCACDFSIESEGGVDGFFGVIPIHFCPTCFSSMCDMVDQLTDDEEKNTWVGLTKAEMDKALNSCDTTDIHKYLRIIEAKLKEKNT
jgi:hypothetical protein